MLVNTARFVSSSPSVEKTPDTDKHEYAFIGRSNVGKSSLINMLTGRKSLAMTSATPGKTMLINHFLVNDSWYIVDLPGYGFAKRSKAELEKLDKMIRDYILYRQQMTNLFLLIDSRHKPQRIDMEFMEWLAENGVPFSIVFTKLDKMSQTAGKKAVAAYCEALLEQWEELPPIFVTSAIDKRGRDELLDYIEQLNRLPVGGYAEDDAENEPLEVEIVSNIEDNKTPTTMDKEEKKQQALEDLPGAAINAADNEKVDEELIKERTCVLDNNPRNNDL